MTEKIREGAALQGEMDKRLPSDYFEGGRSNVTLSFDQPHVEAGNSGEHELDITLGEKVESFAYRSSGKSTLVITVKNPKTNLHFEGSGEQNIAIRGVEDASRVKQSGSATGRLEIIKATSEEIREFKRRVIQDGIDKKQAELAELQKKLENI